LSGTVYIERDGAVAFVVIDNPPVNAGSSDIRKALLATIERVEADVATEAVVLIGAGNSFIAGSDLREFDLPLEAPQLPSVINAIERSAKPYVAALHGAALGGGFELALACDARIAASGTLLGLPETTLGIIPGAGGTQKLPRLTGIAKAIDLICSGKRVSSEQALELGMIDAMSTAALREEAACLALRLRGSKRRIIDRDLPEESAEMIDAAERKALASGRKRPHIEAAIRHIKSSASSPAVQALGAERASFEMLRTGEEAKAMRHIFFAEREAAKGRAGRNAGRVQILNPGVVGAGTMGVGIATAILASGYPVTLVDSDAATARRAEEKIGSLLDRAAAGGRLTKEAVEAARQRLVIGASLEHLAGCDLIIEAIIEDMAAKTSLFAALDQLVDPETVLASNTSYLDIDAIASATQRPGKVIGLHFFSPAHIMKLVEVITGRQSAGESVAAGLAFAKSLGKLPVEAGNGFGFVGNRIYAAYRASCEFMLEDGALPHEIDEALEAFGFAMGPFAVSDTSGLDIAWRMRRQRMASRLPDARYVHIPDRLCEQGRFGRKTGAGYYRYDEAGDRLRDPEVEALIIGMSREKGISRRALGENEIQRRALGAIVNESAHVIEEGIAFAPSDIDVVMVNGYGFPRWLGGPLHWASRQQPDDLVAACRSFVAASGSGYRLGDLRAAGIVQA
jgi:3-hydroxyacyl-CoA dehydrogenase